MTDSFRDNYKTANTFSKSKTSMNVNEPNVNKKVSNSIYERIIIVIPYKAPDTVQRIANTFEQINMKILHLDNVTYLNTKELTETERHD